MKKHEEAYYEIGIILKLTPNRWNFVPICRIAPLKIAMFEFQWCFLSVFMLRLRDSQVNAVVDEFEKQDV